MSTFIATPATQADITVGNLAFYPDISLNTLRNSVRIDQVIENSQLQHIVEQALIIINDKLAGWQQQQQQQGYATIDAIATGYSSTRLIRLYFQAVYEQCKYDLLQQYRDYDSSHQGHDNADHMNGRLDYCLLQMDAAVTAIIGDKPTRVTLI